MSSNKAVANGPVPTGVALDVTTLLNSNVRVAAKDCAQATKTAKKAKPNLDTFNFLLLSNVCRPKG